MINTNFSGVLPKIPLRILRQSTYKKLGIFILFKKIEFSLGGGGSSQYPVFFTRKFRCLATKHGMFAPYENKFLRH